MSASTELLTKTESTLMPVPKTKKAKPKPTMTETPDIIGLFADVENLVFNPNPTNATDVTRNNLIVARDFLKQYPDAKLFTAFYRQKYGDRDPSHVPTMKWKEESTGDIQELAKQAEASCRFRPIFEKKKSKKEKKKEDLNVIGYKEYSHPTHYKYIYFCLAVDQSGFAVVDVDNKDENRIGDRSLAKWEAQNMFLPPTLTSETPSNGKHFIYKCAEPLPHCAHKLAKCVDTPVMIPLPDQDVRGKGDYRVACDPETGLPHAIAELPMWVRTLAEHVTPEFQKELHSIKVKPNLPINCDAAARYIANSMPVCTVGSRNDATFKHAAMLHDFGVDEAMALELLMEHWHPRCLEGGDWSEAELEKCVRSAYDNAQNAFGCKTEEYKRQLPKLMSARRMTGLHLKEINFHDYSGVKTPRPKASLDNLHILCKEYGINVRYNEMTNKVEITFPNNAGVTCSANQGEQLIIDLCLRHDFTYASGIKNKINTVASYDPYHPIIEWLEEEGGEWDGVSRVQDMLDCVVCRSDYPNHLKESLFKRWFVSAIAALYHPTHSTESFKTRNVLVLVGKQYIGKTSFFTSLAPSHLRAVADGAILDMKDKDTIMMCGGHWINELGEVSVTLRRGVEQLKAYITKTYDEYRRPFDTHPEQHPRRHVLCASTNEEKYLKDESGNTRFATVNVTEFKPTTHIDIRQFWLEIYHDYYLPTGKNHMSWFSPAEEVAELEAINKDALQASPVEEVLLMNFDKTADPVKFYRPIEVLHACDMQLNKTNLNIMSSMLRRHFGITKRANGSVFYKLPAQRTGLDET